MKISDAFCLNPCSNGIWSLTLQGVPSYGDVSNGLNPCSNGIWSLTHGGREDVKFTRVS